MPYANTTQVQARTALAARLQDPNNTYWLAPELNLYITLALRMFQALSQFQMDKGMVQLVSATPFYDLRSTLTTPSEPSSPFNSTVTDQYLVGLIQYMLLEPSTGNTWTGTPQFTYAQVIGALQRTMDRFLLQTAILQTYIQINSPSPTEGVLPIPANLIDIRSAYWQDATTKLWYPLWRSDEYQFNSFARSWQSTPALPYMYSVSVTAPLTMQIGPVPINSGNIALVATTNGPTLDITGTNATILPTPDDWCFALLFGTLSELLFTDGPSRDPSRAAYCASIFQSAVNAAAAFPSVLQVQASTGPIWTGSVADLNQYTTSWLNTTGTPSFCGLGGHNLLAASPVPGTPATQLTLDFVRNMLIPTSDSSFLQVSNEQLETILDLAQVLACFKMGGVEFANTQPLYSNFVTLCSTHNARMNATGFDQVLLQQPATRQLSQVPAQYSPGQTTFAESLNQQS